MPSVLTVLFVKRVEAFSLNRKMSESQPGANHTLYEYEHRLDASGRRQLICRPVAFEDARLSESIEDGSAMNTLTLYCIYSYCNTVALCCVRKLRVRTVILATWHWVKRNAAQIVGWWFFNRAWTGKTDAFDKLNTTIALEMDSDRYRWEASIHFGCSDFQIRTRCERSRWSCSWRTRRGHPRHTNRY